MRSCPTFASQRLKGSALGEGMDWMMRNRPSVLEQSIRCAPPTVSMERVCTICTHPLPSSGSRCFMRWIYCFGSFESIRARTTSSTTNHHSPLWMVFLICRPSKQGKFCDFFCSHNCTPLEVSPHAIKDRLMSPLAKSLFLFLLNCPEKPDS